MDLGAKSLRAQVLDLQVCQLGAACVQLRS